MAFAEKTIAAISDASTVLLSTAYPFGKYDKLSDISYITHSDSWQQSHTCHIQFSYTLKFLVGYSATREPLCVSIFSVWTCVRQLCPLQFSFNTYFDSFD